MFKIVLFSRLCLLLESLDGIRSGALFKTLWVLLFAMTALDGPVSGSLEQISDSHL